MLEGTKIKDDLEPLREICEFAVEGVIMNETTPKWAGVKTGEPINLSGNFADGHFAILQWDAEWKNSKLVDPTVNLIKIIYIYGFYTGEEF